MIKVIWLNYLSFIIIDKTAGKEPKGYSARNRTAAEAALKALGVPEKEYKIALAEMEKNHDNIAEFGMLYKGFTFSIYDPKYDVFKERKAA